MSDSPSGAPPQVADESPSPEITDRLLRLWQSGPPPDLDAFLAAVGPLPRGELAAVLRIDQRQRWQIGQRVPVESYLRRHPTLGADADGLLDLIYGEYLLRERHGERPDLAEFALRFPEQADVLRAQVELHRAFAERDSTPAPETGLPSTLHNAAPPDRPSPRGPWPALPGYDILGELGRGGMGVVYRAYDLRLGRVVALKMIKAEEADADQLARFRAEAVAVARLQHANVVQIFEVGESDGRPFFALEFVDGGSLDRRLAGAPVPARDAAQLVEVLAHAVHYAHQRGIVHRDLKPANILLQRGFTAEDAEDAEEKQRGKKAVRGGEAPPRGPASSSAPSAPSAVNLLPKIADFGLAKRLDTTPGPTTTGAILGTPSYLAPEQARGRASEVGPAADVYALGAILYECLTGRPPFRAENPYETVLQVLHTEPIAPRQLQPKLPRDLETVCLKCLQKEPRQRYASAAELAEDLRRFLAGEAIRARPLGPIGHTWRWCRRRPAVAALLATLVVCVLTALGVVTALWWRSESLRERAEQSWTASQVDYKLARESVDSYATKVSGELALRRDDLRPLRKALLEAVVPFYETLAARHSDKPEVQSERAEALLRLADITSTIDEPALARRYLEQAAVLLEALNKQVPEDRSYRARLAKVRASLSDTLFSLEQIDDAEASTAASLALWQRLLDADPEDVTARLGMAQARLGQGRLHYQNGRVPEAMEVFRQVLQTEADLLKRGSPLPADGDGRTFPNAHMMLGLCHSSKKQYDEALAEFGKAADRFRTLAEKQPYDENHRVSLALTHRYRGDALLAQRHFEQAEEEYLQAVRTQEKVVAEQPSVRQHREFLAQARQSLGQGHEATGRLASAVEQLRLGIRDLEALPPGVLALNSNQETLADLRHNLGVTLWALGRLEEATAELRQAIAVIETLSRKAPRNESHRDNLARRRASLGAVYHDAGRVPEAVAEFEAVLPILEQGAKEHPGDPDYEYYLAGCSYSLGRSLRTLQQFGPSEQAIRKAGTAADRGLRTDPDHRRLRAVRARVFNSLGVLCVEAKRPADADAEYRQALEMVRALIKDYPRHIEYQIMLGTYSANRGIALRNAGKAETSLESFAEAVGALEQVLAQEPKHSSARFALASAYWDRARARMLLGRHAQAVADWDKALQWENGGRGWNIRAGRAEALAQSGEHVRAVAEAEELLKETKDAPDLVYWLAWVWSYAVAAAERDDKLADAERKRLAERYGARGVELLRQAGAAGHFKTPANREELNSSPELQPLRARADCKAWLAELDAAAKKD